MVLQVVPERCTDRTDALDTACESGRLTFRRIARHLSGLGARLAPEQRPRGRGGHGGDGDVEEA